MRAARRSAIATLALTVALGTSACGITIPSDPEGSLESVEGGTLRVGYSPDPGRIAEGPGGPTGPIADVVTGYAHTIDADVLWTLGSEETLSDAIDQGELDLAVGGFTEKSPWTDLAALSRGFLPPGAPENTPMSVALLPMGENALLSSFEAYLDEEGLT
ncbi:hypothetical protein GCM10010910_05130 [Microbacterium nanhaiense]|uniref:ABC transporter substrate-binding protein n=1 Tax=Microbacterium nanhaiense TaxID=1301026 RepID=A0ABQ2MZE3_9MICO|nr:hypothetical protein [Microbacterium nanhaiense]GGO60234.1 hypothetical protein GCM10010910_05130 [Microbacterium nanhaiense]